MIKQYQHNKKMITHNKLNKDYQVIQTQHQKITEIS